MHDGGGAVAAVPLLGHVQASVDQPAPRQLWHDLDMAPPPLALLHDHLDGGLRVETVIELADEIGWRLPSADAEDLAAWFTAGAGAGDILQYLATFEHTIAVMQTEAALERVAYEAVIDLASDGVVYAEVRFAPELHQEQGLSIEAVVTAVTSGFARGETDATAQGSGITVGAILCAMRTEQRSTEIARAAAELRTTNERVWGFDLAGAETGFAPSMHAEALALARSELLNITIHASEPPDLELITDALDHGAHRIGHGVRLQSDLRLTDGEVTDLGPVAQYVLDRQIHLEMAPTCHVQIGAVERLEQHPIIPMLRAGFNVGVNTDNRLMSAVMPSTELAALDAIFELTATEQRRLTQNAIRAGFAPHAERQRILHTLDLA